MTAPLRIRTSHAFAIAIASSVAVGAMSAMDWRLPVAVVGAVAYWLLPVDIEIFLVMTALSGILGVDQVKILPVATTAITLPEVLFGALVAKWLFTRMTSILRVPTEQKVWLGTLGVYGAIGFLRGNLRQLWFRDVRAQMFWLIVPVLYSLGGEARKRLLRMLEWLAITVAAAVYIQAMLPSRTIVDNSAVVTGIYRVRPFGQELVFFEFAMLIARMISGNARWWQAAVALLYSGALVLSYSRNFLVAMGMALLIALVLGQGGFARKASWAAAAGVVAAAVTVLSSSFATRFIHELSPHYLTVESSSIFARIKQLELGWAYFVHHLFGAGLGSTYIAGSIAGGYSDIWYLWLAINLGIVGLVVFLVMVTVRVVHLWKHRTWQKVGYIAFLVTLLARCFVTAIPYAPMGIGLIAITLTPTDD